METNTSAGTDLFENLSVAILIIILPVEKYIKKEYDSVLIILLIFDSDRLQLYSGCIVLNHSPLSMVPY